MAATAASMAMCAAVAGPSRPSCSPSALLQPLPQQRRGWSSSSSRQGSGRSSRVAPLQARRQRDPIVAPVIPLGPHAEEAVDLYGYLLRNRIIFLHQRVNDQVATQVVASLLALDSLDSEEEIKLYVNCAAGSPYAVVSILDTMRAVAAPVSTVAFGLVGGAATTILASGAKGRRFSMPSTRIVLQQPMSGLQGSADEVNIQAKEANRNMRILYRFLAEATGLSVERVEEECDRENFLSPAAAVELGLIDGVIEQP